MTEKKKVYCPDCGTPAEDMVMDHALIITFQMNMYGEIVGTEFDEEELLSQALENTLNAQRLFCPMCGGYFSLKLQKDGSIVYSEDTSELEGF